MKVKIINYFEFVNKVQDAELYLLELESRMPKDGLFPSPAFDIEHLGKRHTFFLEEIIDDTATYKWVTPLYEVDDSVINTNSKL